MRAGIRSCRRCGGRSKPSISESGVHQHEREGLAREAAIDCRPLATRHVVAEFGEQAAANRWLTNFLGNQYFQRPNRRDRAL